MIKSVGKETMLHVCDNFSGIYNAVQSCINSFPNDKFSDFYKLKDFADDNWQTLQTKMAEISPKG